MFRTEWFKNQNGSIAHTHTICMKTDYLSIFFRHGKLICRDVEFQLLIISLYREIRQIRKTFINCVKNFALAAKIMEKIHKFIVVAAHNAVAVSKMADITLFQPRKRFIQFLIKIFSITFPQSKSNCKINNALYASLFAHFQKRHEIFPGIIYSR